jgi:uncharacterized protein YndB with AHSA1/START domain
MSTTRMTQHVAAPRAAVYRALTDGEAVGQWMVPDGMTSHVHTFDAREGGQFRISLTYDDAASAGKTSGATDTFGGRFVTLVPDQRVEWALAFESPDPSMATEMTISFDLVDADGGTDIHAVHEGLPSGVSAADNETGWRMSLGKLARLASSSSSSSSSSGRGA